MQEFSLRQKDKNALETGDWLNDLHISAAQKLLRRDFPNIASLQSTLLGNRLLFKTAVPGCVQILHFSGHWACVSTIGCKSGHVNVYDSYFPTPPVSLVLQLCCLLKTEESHLTINLMHMQSQVGASDCGCFAIACATALCHGQNPSHLQWQQSEIRQHILHCFTARKLTIFPSQKRARKGP